MNTNQNENTKESLEKVFKTFISNIDARDVSSLEKTFHDQFTDYVSVSGMEDMLVSNKEKYLQSLKDGKLGGVERKVQINSIDLVDNFGVVKANLQSKVMNFRTQYSFLWNQGDWKVIHALVSAEKI
ncbi:nuclear transport factor 2 family protein [Leptospira levettii]|uniref:nuclear transport factor 2 family protein n=1 Tax=Leptospira levettii TaxID=2023178 RepID=UPI0010825765|nr:nuclear transport factor 2 family protein [Leptospira levettii]TGM31384.1 nuclear transport factor 2 family protein [Leptospira levettii]TGM91756.1 nuclear transport factor 2 family protein [Leptospira levettii]